MDNELLGVDNMKVKKENRYEELIEKILEKDKVRVIDYFPEKIKDWNRYEPIEWFLMKKENRKKYARKIIRILLKLMPYYDVKIVIPETGKKRLKKYEGILPYQKMKISDMCRILQKVIICDEMVFVLIESLKITIQIQLYNTAVYFYEYQEVPLLEKIIMSEGMFYWTMEESEEV